MTRVVGVKKNPKNKSSAQYGSAAATKSGRAFHARAAATGNERSPNVVRRVLVLSK